MCACGVCARLARGPRHHVSGSALGWCDASPHFDGIFVLFWGQELSNASALALRTYATMRAEGHDAPKALFMVGLENGPPATPSEVLCAPPCFLYSVCTLVYCTPGQVFNSSFPWEDIHHPDLTTPNPNEYCAASRLATRPGGSKPT